ncbi:hypothetical protein VCEC0027_000002B, partial [Vibrio cholerae O1 str. EC-0027]
PRRALFNNINQSICVGTR